VSVTSVPPRLPVIGETTRTHCPYCAFQCGMAVTVQAGPLAAIDVRPDDDFPVNRGQMCIKGFTSGTLLDHPDRLKTPLLRGSGGRLVPATWKSALDFIGERLLALRAQHGAASLAAFGSGALTNEKTYLLGKFARVALGTPNIDYNGRYCMSSAAAGQNLAFGVDRGMPFPVEDIAQTRVLVLWGANCADTMPPMMQWVNQQRDRGTLIVVDPRRTETARAAQIHLQLRPGTDLALASGLLSVAIGDGLLDEAYIGARTSGFAALRQHALTVDPAHVERETGISIELQRRVVRMLATAESSMILSGRGPEQQSKGSDTVIALINLMLALGKVGKPFSGYGCITGQGNGQGGREHGQKADQLPGYRLIENAEDRAQIARHWGIDPSTLPGKGKSAYELLDALGPAGGIRALLVFGSNVVVASPNARNVERKLAALDLLVVADAFENETSAFAHVVLPVTQWGEELGTMTNLEGRVILRSPVRAAPAGVKTDLEIMIELARRLGAAAHFPPLSSEQVFAELSAATVGARADYSGITYDKIRENKGVFWPCPSADHPGTPRLFQERFFHADGLARFHAVRDRPSAEPTDDAYPLYFTTGRYREHYNSGAQTRKVAALVEAQPEPRVQIHPRLATTLGAEQGGLLLVESRRGSVTFTVALSPEIRTDTLFAPFHWGGKRAANVLTIAGLDPRSRMPEFKVCAVRARALPAGTAA
jgi:assimilatory nitrate reductase catalytic subunit